MLTIEDRATRLHIINATLLAESMDGTLDADQRRELLWAEAHLAKMFKLTTSRVRQIVEAALLNDLVPTDDPRVNYEVLLHDIAVRLRDDNTEAENCLNCVRKEALRLLGAVRHDGEDELTTIAASTAGALYGLCAHRAVEAYDLAFNRLGPGASDEERFDEIVSQFEFEADGQP